MGDNLHELNRKELKELCGQNNIRTAGVKHEDLVRLLRNKLHPSTPQTLRSTKARSPKMQSPGKEDVESFKSVGKAAGKGRNFRGLSLQREDITPFERKTSSLSRKPLLTKSNTMNTRRTTPTTKTPGLEQDPHENFVRRLCQINGMSPLSRRSIEAPGQLQTASKLDSNIDNPSFFKRESKDGTPSPTLSLAQGNKNENMPSPDGVASDDAGSDASRRVSEIATDAGPDTMSDFSDADEFRSVSSEPISKLPSSSIISKRNISKMSQSGLSFFTAESNWGSEQPRSNLENDFLVDSNRDHHANEVIFPDFAEGSNFLVGDAEGLDLQFLHAGAADPEVIVNGRHDAVDDGKDQVGDQVKNVQDVMDSPMAKHYVTYRRGTETPEMDPVDCNIDARRMSIGSNQGENCDAKETSVEEVDTQRDSGAEDGAELKELGRINVEVFRNQNPEPGIVESTQASAEETMHNSELGDLMPNGMEDTGGLVEIHSELPCFESNSPRFDSKDYSIAKKLVFEPAAPQLQQLQSDGSNSLNGEEGPAAMNCEEKDSALDPKPESVDLDEPTMNDQADIAFETTNASRDFDHGECRLGDQTVEQDGNNEAKQEGENNCEDKSVAYEIEDKSVAPEIEDKSVSYEIEAKLVAPEIEDKSEAHKTEDKSESYEIEDKSESYEIEDKSVAHEIEDKSELYEIEDKWVAHENEDKSVAHKIEDKSESYEIEDKWVAHENEDKSEAYKTEDKWVAHESEDKSVAHESEDKFEAHKTEDKSEAYKTEDKSVAHESEDKSEAHETKDQVTATFNRNESQRHLDTTPVASINDTHLSGHAPPVPDQSSSRADEEDGSDVKARDEECSDTSTTTDYKKEERENETTQVKLSFPLSTLLWCSQWCSPASRNRNPCPRS